MTPKHWWLGKLSWRQMLRIQLPTSSYHHKHNIRSWVVYQTSLATTKPFHYSLCHGCRGHFVNSEFTQQDGRRKKMAKWLCVTNVTGLLLALQVCRVIFLTLMFFALLQNDLFLGMQSLVEGFFKQNHCHACHTRFAVVSPLSSCCISSLILRITLPYSLWNLT